MILTRADLAWHLAREASKHSFPLGSIVIAIAPLMIPALLAYRKRPKTFLEAATRAWPIVAFGVYFLSGTGAAATPLHAFQGITFPLSVLAIEGLQMIPWGRSARSRWVVVAAIAVSSGRRLTISPLVGVSSPASSRSRVDFPAPFTPTTAMRSPGLRM